MRRARKTAAAKAPEPTAAAPARRRRRRVVGTVPARPKVVERQPLVMSSTWRGYRRGDIIDTTKFGSVPFQYHTLNPNNGEEWVTVFLKAGGFRSLFVADVKSGEQPKVVRRRKKVKA